MMETERTPGVDFYPRRSDAEPTERMEHLTYAPLPWETHPIDTVTGIQGWGPFQGPYTPFNFPELVTGMAQGGIDITWNQGNNNTAIAPGYAVGTIQMDNSLALVNNRLAQMQVDASATRNYSSTISNAELSKKGGAPIAVGGVTAAIQKLLGGTIKSGNTEPRVAPTAVPAGMASDKLWRK
jgi:hypothetical protein